MDRVLLFHLSDLHFGSTFEGTCHATTGFQTGLNGHALDIAEKLPIAIRRALLHDIVVTSDDAVAYLVDGDLTRTGSKHDFQLVYTYLYSELKWSINRFGQNYYTLGLNLDLDKVHTVPGNHDHWQGQSEVHLHNPPPAYNANAFPDLLSPTITDAVDPAPMRTICSPNNKIALDLFRVDSNEGLNHNGTNFWAAGELSDRQLDGSFDSAGRLIEHGLTQQMQAAATAAQNDPFPHVAAVACHHAFSNRSYPFNAHALSANSIVRLVQVVRSFHHSFPIRAILTGHTHYPAHRLALNTKGKPNVWEVRCASTLQMDPQPAAQTFLVHEIKISAQGLPIWNTWTYSWNGTDFVKSPIAKNVN